MPADKAVFVTWPHRGQLHRFGRMVSWLGCVWLIIMSSAACGGGLQTVHNIRNAPVVMGQGQQPSAQRVRDAILRALADRGWQLDREGPDGIVATVVSGGHSATILIQYDAHTYSINYLDSSPGLKFNGRSIHRRYNNWIDKLNRTIRKFLLAPDSYGVRVVVPVVAPATVAPPPPATPVEAAPATASGGLVPPPPAAPAPAVAPPTDSANRASPAPPPPPPAATPTK